ncbi:MAG: hypothetical protein LBS31_12155 [Candidatus Adiutrix sp.]|nr:hypothetical protein [Candidatus Adiutrix sp.]
MRTKIFLSLFVLGSALALAGCLNVNEALITASALVKTPDVSGAYTDTNKKTYIVAKDKSGANVFTVTAPDKRKVVVTLAPLASPGRYLAQVQNPDGPEAALTICVIANRQVDLYYIRNAPDLPDLGRKFGLEIDDNGNITSQTSLAETLKFFEACFDEAYSTKVMSIKPRGAAFQG